MLHGDVDFRCTPSAQDGVSVLLFSQQKVRQCLFRYLCVSKLACLSLRQLQHKRACVQLVHRRERRGPSRFGHGFGPLLACIHALRKQAKERPNVHVYKGQRLYTNCIPIHIVRVNIVPIYGNYVPYMATMDRLGAGAKALNLRKLLM